MNEYQARRLTRILDRCSAIVSAIHSGSWFSYFRGAFWLLWKCRRPKAVGIALALIRTGAQYQLTRYEIKKEKVAA